MSKWGIEEQETLDTIKKIGLSGNILNVAAGDGRFNNVLLKTSDSVTAVDIAKSDLNILINNCPLELRDKLDAKVVDITKPLPFNDEVFDCVFCTGTLHLFQKDVVIKILKEMNRVLKKNGKILLDFATDIKRLDKTGKKVLFKDEGSYSTEAAKDMFSKELKNFEINIEVSSFREENLEDDKVDYHFIDGNFLILSGTKK